MAEGATAFTLAFKHRFFFRSSTRRVADFDGGVVEITVDGGKTWKDASELATVDYTTTLDTGGRGSNPLKGRRAYGKFSAGYPDKWIATKLDITLKEPAESVRLRFRVGTGDGLGAPGWDIDDIELTNVATKPFFGFVPHGDVCDGEGPTADAGPGRTVESGVHVTLVGRGSDPKNLPLTFAWTQLEGPPVALTGTNTEALSFDTPDTVDPVTLAFVLRVDDGALLSPASRVDVIVSGAPKYDASGGCVCSVQKASRGGDDKRLGLVGFVGAAGIFAARRRRRR